MNCIVAVFINIFTQNCTGGNASEDVEETLVCSRRFLPLSIQRSFSLSYFSSYLLSRLNERSELVEILFSFSCANVRVCIVHAQRTGQSDSRGVQC